MPIQYFVQKFLALVIAIWFVYTQQTYTYHLTYLVDQCVTS